VGDGDLELSGEAQIGAQLLREELLHALEKERESVRVKSQMAVVAAAGGDNGGRTSGLLSLLETSHSNWSCSDCSLMVMFSCTHPSIISELVYKNKKNNNNNNKN
jgi:hypothetical protein